MVVHRIALYSRGQGLGDQFTHVGHYTFATQGIKTAQFAGSATARLDEVRFPC